MGGCKADPCPVDCKLSEWADDGDCDAECGLGTKPRVRKVVTDAAFGGKACPTEEGELILTQVVGCKADPCPVDCKLSDWADDGDCDAECGLGTKPQVRKVVTKAAFGGKACPTEEGELILTQLVSCKADPCPVDCKLSEWADDGDCDAEC